LREASPPGGPLATAARVALDIILDLSGGTARPRADRRTATCAPIPAIPRWADRGRPPGAAIFRRHLREATLLSRFDASLGAQSRSGIIGFAAAIDLCPAGAIAPAAIRWSIDP